MLPCLWGKNIHPLTLTLWPGSPNHMTFVTWSLLEQWGFRFDKGDETHTPDLLLLRGFLSQVFPVVTLRSLPDASAPHTMTLSVSCRLLQGLGPPCQFSIGTRSRDGTNQRMPKLSFCFTSECPTGPRFPIAQPLSFFQKMAFVPWGRDRYDSCYSRDSVPKSREIHRIVC